MFGAYTFGQNFFGQLCAANQSVPVIAVPQIWALYRFEVDIRPEEKQ